MDVWVALDPDNAVSIVKALDQFGFGSLGRQASDFLVPDQIIQLGNPPSRIDILTTLPGVDFASCYPSRIEVEVDGARVNFIDLDNLKKNKQASGRHRTWRIGKPAIESGAVIPGQLRTPHRAPKRLPVVMTHEEVKAVLRHLHSDKGLMAALMYGAGLRLMECLSLRVQDIDFAG